MHRDNHGTLPRSQTGYLGVIGAIAGVKTGGALGLICVAIGGYDGAIIELHQKGRIVLAAVGVYHQAREIGGHHRRIQQLTQMTRHRIGADIIGDVTLHILMGKAKVSAIDKRGDMIGRVIAGDQPAGRAVSPVHIERYVGHNSVIIC